MATYSVDGSRGLITTSGAGETGSQQLAALDLQYQDLSFTADWVTGSGDLVIKTAYRYDSGVYYGMDFAVDLDTETVTQITLTDSGTPIATKPVSIAHTPGVPMGIRVHSTDWQRARIWSTAGMEPSTWNFQFPHNDLPSGAVAVGATATTVVPAGPPLTGAYWMWGAEAGNVENVNVPNFAPAGRNVVSTFENLSLSTLGAGRGGFGYAAVVTPPSGPGTNGFFEIQTAGGFPASNQLAITFYVKFAGTLPVSGAGVFNISPGSLAQRCSLEFDQVTGKLVFRGNNAGSGGTTVIGPSVVADTWYRIDIGYNGIASTALQWAVDGVTQTTVTVSAVGGAYSSLVWGHTTITVGHPGPCILHFDDLIVSSNVSDYPIGAISIKGLIPDPAGTVTEIGTANSLARFTTGGAVLDATFNAANVRAALSTNVTNPFGSADGAYVRVADANAFLQVPMSTYTLGAGEVIGAVRLELIGWENSPANPNNIQILANVGGTNTLLRSGDPNWNPDNNFGWSATMFNPVTGWTQANLDNFNIVFGGSSDNSPQPGINYCFAEVAVRGAAAAPVTVYFEDFDCIECQLDT